MKHTNHYTRYLQLKEQAINTESMSVKATIMAQANRELRKHQAINRAITESYQAKLEAKYANTEDCIDSCPIEEESKPKRGRKPKEQ